MEGCWACSCWTLSGRVYSTWQPETCWASYKYGIITFWYTAASCWIFFVNYTMTHGSTNMKTANSHSNTNTQLDATINCKFYCFVVQTLLDMFRALLCPSSGACQTAIAASGFLLLLTQTLSFMMIENQRLQRQFDGLLMMGIVMPETCRAVSVRQTNKIYDWLLHLVGCLYLSDWRCTEPQTLNTAKRVWHFTCQYCVIINGL